MGARRGGDPDPLHRLVLVAPRDGDSPDHLTRIGRSAMKAVSRTARRDVRRAPMAGKTVLVTGASGGIGRATALGLAEKGAHPAIPGRDRGRTEGAAREIRTAGGGQ